MAKLTRANCKNETNENLPKYVKGRIINCSFKISAKHCLICKSKSDNAGIEEIKKNLMY